MRRQISNCSCLIALCVLFVFTGCAHLSTEHAKSREALLDRVEQEWKARVGKDWGTVYDMTIDAYQKKMARDKFIRRANLNIQEFSVKDVKIVEPGKKGLAVVDYKFNQMGYNFASTYKEEWLWENGEWRLNLLPTLELPFGNKKSSEKTK